MSKKPSTFFNMVWTLFIISFFSSAALGFVYELTKGPIAKATLEKKIRAIQEVVPAFDNNPLEEVYKVDVDAGTLFFYPAKKQDKLVGTAVETFTTKGFSGTIKLMVGLLPDGTINKIVVVEAHETPGLGDKIKSEKSNFSKQFMSKNPSVFMLKVKKDGGSVDAITAATISSRAFCDAVTRACQSYKKELKK
ncbi:MAG: RnfABCDGE type electron transport complex subunit G [Candidatus Omnitrophota bacterium]